MAKNTKAFVQDFAFSTNSYGNIIAKIEVKYVQEYNDLTKKFLAYK